MLSALLAALLLAAAPPAGGAGGDLDGEFAFASWLVGAGFPDFAERLVERLVRENPAARDRAMAVQAEILVGKRQFREAEELVERMPAGSPKTQAALLAIGNGYYRLGEIDRARSMYELFFGQYKEGIPDDPDLKRFFMDAAYRLGQMLETAGDFRGAAEAFEKALAGGPEATVARRLRAELADLLVRAARGESDAAAKDALLKRAAKLCEETQWSGIDLWFGRTIITLANIELVRGEEGKARRVIRDNLDILRQIDELLRKEDLPLSMSPMAGARFLLGRLYEHQGEALLAAGKRDEAVRALGASLVEYFNVFAKYGDSEWGPDAGVRAEDLKKRLEGMGRTVKVDLGPYRARAMEAQFKMADTLFLQKQYDRAATAYLAILNRYPEGGAVGRPMRNLFVALAAAGREREVRAAAAYVAERFAGDAEAGLALLAAGKHYFDAKNGTMHRWLYELFVQGFPKHEKTPAILYNLAALAREAGDAAANRARLKQIVDGFPGDPYYLRALSLQGWGEYEAGRYEDAAAVYRLFVEQSPPSHERANARFITGDCLIRAKRYADALREYDVLRKWLTPPEAAAYGRTGEELAKNRDMLEKAVFYTGYALAKIGEPADQVAALRGKAVEVLRQFVEAYPASDLAPRALHLVGTVQLERGESDAATATFRQLQEKYPESEDGKSALFALVRAALEIERFDTAQAAWEKIRAEPALYTPDQFVRIGQWMLDAGRFAEAIEAFDLVVAGGGEDRSLLERSYYGLGRAHFERKEYDRAAEAIGELLSRYPKSGLFYDAKFILGRALRAAGRPAEAMAALGDVFKYSTDPVLINTASMELAGLQVELGDRAAAAGQAGEAATAYDAALASYQRIALLTDADDPGLRPFVERSLVASVPLFLRVERYADAIEACEMYVEVFPDGAATADVRKWLSEARLKASAAAGPGGGGSP